jgi:hypothetical protein
MNDSKPSMKVVNMEELKGKLDRVDNFKLVKALGEGAFNAENIPGSINISKIEDAGEYYHHDPNTGKSHKYFTLHVLVTNCN